MKIGQIIKKMKEDSINYYDETQEYVCTVQRAFSAGLVVFFSLHLIVVNALDWANRKQLSPALWISALQIIFALLGYLAFKYYFPKHKKYLLVAAYFNIFQIIAAFELQYSLYDEYISYTVIVCILLTTSFTVIGHICGYASIVFFSIVLDVITTIVKNYEIFYTNTMYLYIIDVFFVVIIAVGINIFFTWLKYQDFTKEQQILYLSERDSLTDLLNRKALEYAVHKQSNNKTLCAMILLDLDNFKTLNDTLGHYAGDDCLRAVANSLKAIFQSEDCVCRLGGDEFVIFMSNLSSRNHAIDKTKAILQKVPCKYPWNHGEIAITCSVGVAFAKATGENLYEKLYKAADSVMYQSKTNGKNSVTVYEKEL